MKNDRSVFEKLLDFVRTFPHYFVGSNVDLPIVGGSILMQETGRVFAVVPEDAGVYKNTPEAELHSVNFWKQSTHSKNISPGILLDAGAILLTQRRS